MTRMRGTEHFNHPRAEPLVEVDISQVRMIRDTVKRYEWNLENASRVCRGVASTGGAFKAFTGILDELGETLAWKTLGEFVLANGYDLYRDDDRFEVFRGHTDPVDNEPQTIAEAVHALAVAAQRTSLMLPDASTSVAYDTVEEREAWALYPAQLGLPALGQLALALEIWDSKLMVERDKRQKKELS